MMQPEFLDTTLKFTRDAVRILVKKEERMPQGIRQSCATSKKEGWKFGTLCDFYETLTITQVIVYRNTR